MFGEPSRRGRGHPRRVPPPPPYVNSPVWYPRVTRSLTPAKIDATETAYTHEFLRRWAHGDFNEYLRGHIWDSDGEDVIAERDGSNHNEDGPQPGAEENPILIEDDEDDGDDDEETKGPLRLVPGLYQLVPVPQMEVDMEIDDDDEAPAPPVQPDQLFVKILLSGHLGMIRSQW